MTNRLYNALIRTAQRLALSANSRRSRGNTDIDVMTLPAKKNCMQIQPSSENLFPRYVSAPLRFSAANGASGGADADSDDIDEQLEDTGDVSNGSNGKTGTYTEAEPDKK